MRIAAGTLLLSACVLSTLAQTVNKNTGVVGPGYSYMKYALSFADQVQLAYDGMDLNQSRFMPSSIAEIADLDFYRGKYGNAAGEYYSVIGSLPQRTDLTDKQMLQGSFSLYKSAMVVVNYNGLNEDGAKLYSSVANAAGLLYQVRGKFTYAEAMLERAMQVRAQRFGKTSREYINSLCNWAVMKKDLGEYDEAEKILNYLTKTIPKLFTARSTQNVVVLNNKAMLLAELGRTKEAIQLLDEVLEMGKEVLPDNYIDYERILTNRALIEQESGSMEKAAAFYKTALERMQQKGYDDHPDYNNVLVYYGSLRVQQNDSGVLGFLEDASNKVRKRYGESHLLYAKAQNNLANYYLNLQSYAEAKAIFMRVAIIRLKLLGDKHKEYLNTLVMIALCDWYLNDHPSAAANFRKAIDSYLFLLNSFFASMSETEKGKFWSTLKPNVDAFLSFAVATGETDQLKDAFDLHLKTKGLLFNSTNRIKSAILASEDSVVHNLYSNWLDLKNTLAIYYSASLEDIAEDKIDIADLELQVNRVERELSKRSQLFETGYADEASTFEAVRNHLLANEAAVEIIRISYPYGAGKGDVEYAGLVVTREGQYPRLVRVKDGRKLEGRSLMYYKNSIQARVEESVSYQTYWQPFASALTDVRKIYVSVDGIYNSINLNTLRLESGKYLIDEFNIVLVPTTKLVGNKAHEAILSRESNPAILVGSPAYGDASVINPLPGTKIEIQKVNELLQQREIKTEVMMEQAASEGNLKAVSHPSVLHIATHGYFLSDANLSGGMAMGVRISKAKENPLLRSGLLFSGAAAAMDEGPTISREDNGILNAYEAMNLDLKDTQLVIMSACETGSGEIVNGEGVYGLSRSFQVAGAKKIIMSLWKVDDEATQELMTNFYSSWAKTSDPHEAFLLAQRTVKAKYQEPYYWGAFVLLN